MESYFYSEKNVDRLCKAFDAKIKIKKTRASQLRKRNLIKKHMRLVFTKYGNRKTKVKMVDYVRGLNKRSLKNAVDYCNLLLSYDSGNAAVVPSVSQQQYVHPTSPNTFPESLQQQYMQTNHHDRPQQVDHNRNYKDYQPPSKLDSMFPPMANLPEGKFPMREPVSENGMGAPPPRQSRDPRQYAPSEIPYREYPQSSSTNKDGNYRPNSHDSDLPSYEPVTSSRTPPDNYHQSADNNRQPVYQQQGTSIEELKNISNDDRPHQARMEDIVNQRNALDASLTNREPDRNFDASKQIPVTGMESLNLKGRSLVCSTKQKDGKDDLRIFMNNANQEQKGKYAASLKDNIDKIMSLEDMPIDQTIISALTIDQLKYMANKLILSIS